MPRKTTAKKPTKTEKKAQGPKKDEDPKKAEGPLMSRTLLKKGSAAQKNNVRTPQITKVKKSARSKLRKGPSETPAKASGAPPVQLPGVVQKKIQIKENRRSKVESRIEKLALKRRWARPEPAPGLPIKEWENNRKEKGMILDFIQNCPNKRSNARKIVAEMRHTFGIPKRKVGTCIKQMQRIGYLASVGGKLRIMHSKRHQAPEYVDNLKRVRLDSRPEYKQRLLEKEKQRFLEKQQKREARAEKKKLKAGAAPQRPAVKEQFQLPGAVKRSVDVAVKQKTRRQAAVAARRQQPTKAE